MANRSSHHSAPRRNCASRSQVERSHVRVPCLSNLTDIAQKTGRFSWPTEFSRASELSVGAYVGLGLVDPHVSGGVKPLKQLTKLESSTLRAACGMLIRF